MAKDLRIKVSSETSQAEAGLKKVGSAIDGLGVGKAATDMGAFAASVVRTGLAAAGISVSLAKVVSTAKEAVSLYASQAKAEASLAAAIKATGQQSSYSVGELKKLANAFQDVTTYGGDAILPVTQMLLQTQKIGTEIMPEATEAVLDMATAMGTGLTENAKTLARALEDPVNGVTLLKKSMVSFSDTQKATIANFVEQGDIVSAQKVILDQLAATYGGLARAQGTLDVAKIDQIKNTLGDIKTNIGQSIIDGLNPAMAWLLDKLQTVNDRIAQANRESGVVSPTEMTDEELHRTWENLSSRIERYRKQYQQAEDAGDGSTMLITQSLIDEASLVYDPIAAEVNRRAKEAGYTSATAYGKAYLERMAKLKLDNPVTLHDEKTSMRAALGNKGMAPSSVGIATTAKAEADALVAAQDSIYQLVTATEGYQRILIEEENERLLALKEINNQAMENKNLTQAQVEGYLQLNSLLDEQLKLNQQQLDGQSQLEAFLEANKAYAQETAEQERDRLLAAHDIAQAYQRQNDLTEEQRKLIGQIIYGIEKALAVVSDEGTKTAAILATQFKTEMQEAWDDAFPMDGIRKAATELQAGFMGAKEFISENFGSIIDWGKSVFSVIEDAQKKASEAQIKTLEKQIAAEKKLLDKQTKTINSQHEARTQSLADKYAWGLMNYEDYIAAQLALDNDKTASEEAAAERYKKLEKEKQKVQNDVAKTAFENQKNQSIVEAIILGAQAIMQGYASLGPIGGSIAAAVIAGVTVAQVATISSQKFTPQTALADGGVAYRPTTALIGEGGEPEAVVPLSRAHEFGFGGVPSQKTSIVVNVNAPTYSGDQLAESIAEGIARGQRIGRIPAWGV